MRLTESWTTAAVGANTNTQFNRVLAFTASNAFKILKLLVTPSIAATNMKVELYKKDTFLAADRAYGTGNFVGPLVEPMEDTGAGPVARNEGFVAVYKDDDSTGELHYQIYNNHTVGMTYDVVMIYEPEDTIVKVDGSTIGTTSIIDFKSGNRMTVTGVLNTNTIEVTSTAANQGAALEALLWSTMYL